MPRNSRQFPLFATEKLQFLLRNKTAAFVLGHKLGSLSDLARKCELEPRTLQSAQQHGHFTPELERKLSAGLNFDTKWREWRSGTIIEFEEKYLAHQVKIAPERGTLPVVLTWENLVSIAGPLCKRIEEDFPPDLVITMSGPGSWAAMYTMSIRQRNPPVMCAVTFPIKEKESRTHRMFERAAAPDFWLRMSTKRWLIYLPDIFRSLPKDIKILIFDDRVVSGESQKLLRDELRNREFLTVKTAALFHSGDKAVYDLDYGGQKLEGEFSMPWGPKSGRS